MPISNLEMPGSNVKMPGSNVLEGKNLKLIRNRRRILDVSEIQIRKGEVVAIIGPNGAGKTSLLHVLACLERPTSGELYFQGQKITRETNLLIIRRRMAVVMQEPLLLDTTVFENVALGLRLRGLPRDQIRPRVTTWLERFGIAHLERQWARTLSGGESQRASLARAFALNPEVLFLDEPFAALDTPTKRPLLRELHDIIKSTNTTTVFITHNLDEVRSLADRVLAMSNGSISNEGFPASLNEARELHEFPI